MLIIRKNLLRKFNSYKEYFEKVFFSNEKKYSLLLQIKMNNTKKLLVEVNNLMALNQLLMIQYKL